MLLSSWLARSVEPSASALAATLYRTSTGPRSGTRFSDFSDGRQRRRGAQAERSLARRPREPRYHRRLPERRHPVRPKHPRLENEGPGIHAHACTTYSRFRAIFSAHAHVSAESSHPNGRRNRHHEATRRRIMTSKDSFAGRVRVAFMENLGLKILSLACALALYALQHGSEPAQRTFAVSLILIMPPESANRQLLTPLPTEIGVTLGGPRKQLDELHADDIGSARIDLRDARDNKIDLDPPMFHIPAGLVVQQIIPSSIKVQWDDVIAKAVPVQVSRTGELAAGFAVKGVITADPSQVQARGPRSVVDVIQFARAAPFDVSGLPLGMHRIKLALDKPPSLVTYEVDHVTALVQIERQLVSKTLPKLRVEMIGLTHGTCRPSTVTVIISGTAEDVNPIPPDAVVPRVEPKAAGDDVNKFWFRQSSRVGRPA